MKVRKSTSSPSMNCPAVSAPSSRPRLTACSGSRPSFTTHQTIGGTSQAAVMCRCPLDWLTIPGAKPQKTPPMSAASRCMPAVRAKSRYQPIPFAARLTPVTTAKVTGAPSARVSGAKSSPSPISEALPIRLTPSGAFSAPVTRAKSPR
jgi:hypothetical protein